MINNVMDKQFKHDTYEKMNFIISLATFMCDRATALLQLGHTISSWSAQNVAKTKTVD